MLATIPWLSSQRQGQDLSQIKAMCASFALAQIPLCLSQARMKVGRSKTAARAPEADSSTGLLLPACAKVLYECALSLFCLCRTIAWHWVFSCCLTVCIIHTSLAWTSWTFPTGLENTIDQGLAQGNPDEAIFTFFSCRGGEILAFQTFCVQGHGRALALFQLLVQD